MEDNSPTEGTVGEVAEPIVPAGDSYSQQQEQTPEGGEEVGTDPVANIASEEDKLDGKDDSLNTNGKAQETESVDVALPAAVPVVVTPEQEKDRQDETGNQDSKTDAVVLEKTTSPKKEAGTFSLGVPGLKFSSSNVKTSKDGTKMVQIHQSQITPEQLEALQSNPNIKVVFRHVPSGKSYIKPPKHLLAGYESPAGKRKSSFMEGEFEGPDVYSFDEGEDFDAPAKRAKLADARARYSFSGSAKKKGRPRVVPDSSTFAASFMTGGRQSALPSKVILTDLLARVNNPSAKKEVKLHTSQINTEVLANMELNPAFRIVLTTKQELPPLIIENVDAEEQAKLENDAADIEMQEKEDAVKRQEEAEEKMEEDVQQDEEEQRRLEEEREEEERRKEAARIKRLAEEEEELKKAAMQTQISRSGRIRKPSRFSLDIARLTKRKSAGIGGDSSADESEQEVTMLKKFTKPAVVTSSPAKVRGRPKKKQTPTSPEEPKEDEKKIEQDGKEKPGVEEMERVDHEDGERPVEAEEQEKVDLKEGEKPETNYENNGGEDLESEKEIASAKIETDEGTEKVEAMDEQPAEDSEKDAAAMSTEPDTENAKTKTETCSTSSHEEAAPAAVDGVQDLTLDEEEEEPTIIDNRYRLRKLLEQCSTEEIRSVMLPEAFDSINIGDFLLYKAGQLHNSNGKISFPQLYKEFECLHKDASKEATRYNTLVRRANKVGGDKRMEKIVLMPVYNVDAANSLEISNSSIDAQICGIQRTITTEMIAANSFFIKTKMDSPLIRLSFPEVTAPKQSRPKQKQPLYSNQYQQPEPDSTTQDKPKPKPQKRQVYGQKISSMRFTTYQGKGQNSESGIQVRRPAYIEQLKSTGQITLAGQNHQLSAKTQENILQNASVDSGSLLKADVQSSQMVASATYALAQLQATVEQQRQQAEVSTDADVAINPTGGPPVGTADTTLVTSDAAGQAEQFLVTEEGTIATTAVTEGEVRKHLVPIDDGQYVELPEGYSIIQTDEGYIIGQPGSTFARGEDGNVYITNSDGTTTEITQDDMSGAGEAVVVSGAAES